MILTNKVLNINNRRTTMRLCPKEWEALADICKRENIRRNALISLIEDNKSERLGLTYATRLFSLLYYQSLALPSKEKLISKIMPQLKP